MAWSIQPIQFMKQQTFTIWFQSRTCAALKASLSLISETLLERTGECSAIYWISEVVLKLWLMSLCCLLLWNMIKVQCKWGPRNRPQAKHQFVWIKRPILPGSAKMSFFRFKGRANEARSHCSVREAWCGVNYWGPTLTVNQLRISTGLSDNWWAFYSTTQEERVQILRSS